MTASEIVKKYISFFEERGHKRIANAPLVPINDPSTLFTSSGMQPLVPYLLGEKHSQGTRLVNVQNSFRAQDIDEVGNNRHTTFFRMLGNWSLGDYFKKEQLPWIFEFLTDKEVGLGLDPKRLYVTVFAGNNQIPKDTESIEIWKKVFSKVGIDAKEGERIFTYGVEKNWWSRSGVPEKMPTGEPGGPDSEVFYDFEDETVHKNSQWKNEPCHVNCDCGRYIEIANSVFMQYQKQSDGSFKELPNKNVDFGGGLERFLQAAEHQQDVFKTSLFKSLRTSILNKVKGDLTTVREKRVRIFLDHSQAAFFLIAERLVPGKNEQGSVLRRLIRRADDQLTILDLDSKEIWTQAVEHFKNANDGLDGELWRKNEILDVINYEINTYKKVFSEKNIQFIKSKISTNDNQNRLLIEENLKKYLKEEAGEVQLNLNTYKSLGSIAAGTVAFDAQSTLGVPIENTFNIAKEILKGDFREDEAKGTVSLFKIQHQNVSKAGADKKFRGGLADHSERTIMGHTATHLLHQALRDVLGDQIHQTGSNITSERVRFDFNYDKRLTDEQVKQVEDIVNQKIKDNLPVHFELIDTKEAHKMGAIGLFMDTYGDKSKIYFIDGAAALHRDAYSIEFCGGPHVDFTGVLKSVKIIKQENLGKNQKRLYAVVEK